MLIVSDLNDIIYKAITDFDKRLNERMSVRVFFLSMTRNYLYALNLTISKTLH